MTAIEDAPASTAEIGNARKRREDKHLITGRTTWVDNMTVPGMVHLAILRSPMAHATITSIDTTEAKGRPGVIAVYTLSPDQHGPTGIEGQAVLTVEGGELTLVGAS